MGEGGGGYNNTNCPLYGSDLLLAHQVKNQESNVRLKWH
jgi:hypothetical protein